MTKKINIYEEASRCLLCQDVLNTSLNNVLTCDIPFCPSVKRYSIADICMDMPFSFL